MSIYKGVKKRWIEGDYAGAYRPGENGIEIRSPLFGRYLGRESVKVKSVGFYQNGDPKPLVICTDLLKGKLDSGGAQINGETDGLYYPNMGKDAEPTLDLLKMLLQRCEEENFLTILPGDQHENPRLFDPNALTTTVLDKDLSLLSKRERKIVNSRFKQWIGRRLPAGIWREIFMDSSPENPRATFMGKEERNFLPHCTEGIVEYLDFVLDAFKKQRAYIDAQVASGALSPEARLLPVPKDGLTVEMPGDERGMNGNKFDGMLKAAFTGGYFQGDEHRHKKVAVVAGACYEYSVRLLIEHLVDADINVVCLLSATKGLDLFSSKLHTAHYLKELYGKKLFFTYDWIEELMGKKPQNWDRAAKRVKKADQTHHDSWFRAYQDQLNRGVTSMGRNIVMNKKELAAAAGIR